MENEQKQTARTNQVSEIAFGPDEKGDDYSAYSTMRLHAIQLERELIAALEELAKLKATVPHPNRAEVEAGINAGKKWQYKQMAGRWLDGLGSPLWYKNLEYRLAPEPKMVPLGPEDVPPGSVIRNLIWGEGAWVSINVSIDGISWVGIHRIGETAHNYEASWQRLMEFGFEISRDGGKTWAKCEKEEAI